MQVTLKAARVNAGLTQDKAAKKLDISKSTLQKWEAGQYFPDARNIEKIERLYGFSYDQIIFLPKDYA